MGTIRTWQTLIRPLALGLLVALSISDALGAVRIKDLARFDGQRENSILGYGLVVGLAGTGDTPRNYATQQSVSNMLREFGVNVPPLALNSRNVAAVIVTARVAGVANAGDRLDVNVAAMGDARSLAGGTLLVTPLIGVDREVYASAQGPLTVSGFVYEQAGSSEQKNHPTAGVIPEGAILERSLALDARSLAPRLELILRNPDYTTSRRVAAAINARMPELSATPIDAARVRLAGDASVVNRVELMAAIESLTVEPDVAARVIVNERSGTVVAGGDIWLSPVTITQGDIRVSVVQRYQISQPEGIYSRPSNGIRTAVVPEATVAVNEAQAEAVTLPAGATIADLVSALRAIRATSRDVIAILQGMKRAGALHAELVIQ
jgi:flagellar P-ring protein FlgI